MPRNLGYSVFRNQLAAARALQLTWQGPAGFLPGDQEPVAFKSLHDLVQYWNLFPSNSVGGAVGMISDVFAVPALPTTTAIALVQYLLINGQPLLPAQYVVFMAPAQVASWAWKCNQELGMASYAGTPAVPMSNLDASVQYIAVANPESGKSDCFAACMGALVADFTKLTPVTM